MFVPSLHGSVYVFLVVYVGIPLAINKISLAAALPCHIWVILARCRSFGFEAAKFRIGLIIIICALHDEVNHRKLW